MKGCFVLFGVTPENQNNTYTIELRIRLCPVALYILLYGGGLEAALLGVLVAPLAALVLAPFLEQLGLFWVFAGKAGVEVVDFLFVLLLLLTAFWILGLGEEVGL